MGEFYQIDHVPWCSEEHFAEKLTLWRHMRNDMKRNGPTKRYCPSPSLFPNGYEKKICFIGLSESTNLLICIIKSLSNVNSSFILSTSFNMMEAQYDCEHRQRKLHIAPVVAIFIQIKSLSFPCPCTNLQSYSLCSICIS